MQVYLNFRSHVIHTVQGLTSVLRKAWDPLVEHTSNLLDSAPRNEEFKVHTSKFSNSQISRIGERAVLQLASN